MAALWAVGTTPCRAQTPVTSASGCVGTAAHVTSPPAPPCPPRSRSSPGRPAHHLPALLQSKEGFLHPGSVTPARGTAHRFSPPSHRHRAIARSPSPRSSTHPCQMPSAPQEQQLLKELGLQLLPATRQQRASASARLLTPEVLCVGRAAAGRTVIWEPARQLREQQGEGGSPPPLLCPGEAPSAVL